MRRRRMFKSLAARLSAGSRLMMMPGLAGPAILPVAEGRSKPSPRIGCQCGVDYYRRLMRISSSHATNCLRDDAGPSLVENEPRDEAGEKHERHCHCERQR